MKACKNCKWWGVWNHQECDFIDTIHSSKNPLTLMEIDVFASDDSGLYARFKTGPDFYCAHFTQKEKIKE